MVRVIRVAREEAPLASFIKNKWKPRGAFRITRVNLQSFKVGFYKELDYARIKAKKWKYIGSDLILVRQWRVDESPAEDALDTIPQTTIIHNIPGAMWGEEAIGRIASSLGSPIEARAAKPTHPKLPLPLEVCVIIGKGQLPVQYENQGRGKQRGTKKRHGREH